MSYPGPPVEFTRDRPLRLIVGPNDSGICVTSESQPELAVDGTVELHLAFAQEKQIERVTLTFSSCVLTRIRSGDHTFFDSAKPCEDVELMLWRIGAAYPPPGEHVLRFPFSVSIPANVPPSMHEVGRHQASITYKLVLRGERSVTFGFDVHIERKLNVIPPDLNIDKLHPTGSGGDLVRVGRLDISRSMFKHGKGHVDVKLDIPGQNHCPFPIDTRLPFTVVVSTFSVPVYETSDPETDKDALCPSINIAALHLLLRVKLKRYTTLRVRRPLITKQRNIRSHHLLSNFQDKDTLNVDIGPKEWVACIGDDKELRGKGHWKQQFVFRSSLRLSSQLATPTFKHTLVDVDYALKLECIIPSQKSLVPDHCIKIKLPIVISSTTSSASSHRSASSPLLADADVGKVYSG